MVPNRKTNEKYYRVEKGDGDFSVPCDSEIKLEKGRNYAFVEQPARIEVRLPSVRADNEGTVRVVFIMARLADDDVVMIKESVDMMETFDLDLEEFPDLPAL